MRSFLGSVLMIAALAVLVVAVIGLIRGRTDWARIRSRKDGGIALAVAFALLLLAGTVLPKEATDADKETAPAAPTSTVTTAPSTSTSTSQTSTTTAVPVAPTTTVTVPAPIVSIPETQEQETVAVPVPPVVTTQHAPPIVETTQYTEPIVPRVSYRNCDDVRAAGAAPLYRGEPGYSTSLDRDRDGIACDT